MNEQLVILVTEQDEPTGLMEKMQAHREGVLHRAFSVFIFDRAGRMLLQQRARQKYHGAGLWSNACCSHPLPGEAVEPAAQRRLQEELGFCTSLEKIFSFTYKAAVENDLVEHEFDHVFAGEYEGPVPFNPEEVADCLYEDMTHLKETIHAHPGRFTTWFRLAFPTIETWWVQRYGNSL